MANNAPRFPPLVLILSFAATASGCATDEEPPQDAGDTRYEDCQLWCSEVDADPLNFPANMCPGWNPDEDTAYNACVGECVARQPDGHWCPPP